MTSCRKRERERERARESAQQTTATPTAVYHSTVCWESPSSDSVRSLAVSTLKPSKVSRRPVHTPRRPADTEYKRKPKLSTAQPPVLRGASAARPRTNPGAGSRRPGHTSCFRTELLLQGSLRLEPKTRGCKLHSGSREAAGDMGLKGLMHPALSPKP